jgi:Glutathione S-transferase, N-terminal domain
MKLYVCWGTFHSPRPGGHPCGNAYRALKAAGHDPEVVKSYGLGPLPDFVNNTSGRREVKELTGQSWVPVLVTDDGKAIHDSRKIVEWAEQNPVVPSPS